jgi:hypothetical protein
MRFPLSLTLGMLSVTTCRKILGEVGKTLSDEEVWEIRDLLYRLGKFDFERFQLIKRDENSSHIQQGFNG